MIRKLKIIFLAVLIFIIAFTEIAYAMTSMRIKVGQTKHCVIKKWKGKKVKFKVNRKIVKIKKCKCGRKNCCKIIGKKSGPAVLTAKYKKKKVKIRIIVKDKKRLSNNHPVNIPTSISTIKPSPTPTKGPSIGEMMEAVDDPLIKPPIPNSHIFH